MARSYQAIDADGHILEPLDLSDVPGIRPPTTANPGSSGDARFRCWRSAAKKSSEFAL